MSKDNSAAIHHINELAKELFEADRALTEYKVKHAQEVAVREAAHADGRTKLEGAVNNKYDEILAYIKQYEAELIKPGKRSFATSAATFRFTTVRARAKIIDSESIMKMARKLRIVSQIATPPRTGWKFTAKRFWSYLEKNGEMRAHFEPWIEESQEYESLSIKPNQGHDVTYDSRLTPPPITPTRTGPA